MGVITLPPPTEEDLLYPESDGKPMADNTKQFRYIVIIKEGLEIVFKDAPQVFIAGDLLWYAVQGQPSICTAPDAMVVFGRPKGDRRSYRQWREANIAPQVVFEVLSALHSQGSPSNTEEEMARKFAFYQRYGVEEYYLYDPDDGTPEGWQRIEGRLQPVAQMQGWISPRLWVRFALKGRKLELYTADGHKFETPVEIDARAARERQRAERAEAQSQRARQRAKQEHGRAEQARERAEQAEVQREQARQRAEQAEAQREQERQLAEKEHRRAEQLAAQLRALGIEVEA